LIWLFIWVSRRLSTWCLNWPSMWSVTVFTMPKVACFKDVVILLVIIYSILSMLRQVWLYCVVYYESLVGKWRFKEFSQYWSFDNLVWFSSSDLLIRDLFSDGCCAWDDFNSETEGDFLQSMRQLTWFKAILSDAEKLIPSFLIFDDLGPTLSFTYWLVRLVLNLMLSLPFLCLMLDLLWKVVLFL